VRRGVRQMKTLPFTFTIGQGQWDKHIRDLTAEMDAQYWMEFHPVAEADVAKIESETHRKLAPDLKEFLRVFGAGWFPQKFGGGIYMPTDMTQGCHMHLAMVLGSLGSSPWASEEGQRRYYVTRGQFNPAPDKYTEEAVRLEDVSLLDLMQIGNDGLCGYMQVYVGDAPPPFGFCIIRPERQIERRAGSFSEGLRTLLNVHWAWDDPPEECWWA
jgi:hypothetical protein